MEPPPREFSKLSARELLMLYEGRTAIQANKQIESYVGLWASAHGYVRSIEGDDLSTIVTLEYGVYVFRCQFLTERWGKALSRLSPRETIDVIGEIHPVQDGREFYLFNCELPPSQPERETRSLSPEQRERKLRVLDKLRAHLLVMQPLIREGERLQWGAWNAFHTGHGVEYHHDLKEFRDELDKQARALNAMRDQHSEYDDIITATVMPNWETWVQAASAHFILMQALSNYLDLKTPQDPFSHIVRHSSETLHAAVIDYIRWHNDVRTRLDQMCREMVN